MPKTSIIINSQDTLGKSTQRSFTDVNPKAQNSDLATFGQRLTAMTSNVHGGTIRIDKTDCDNDDRIQRSIIPYINAWSESEGRVKALRLTKNATRTVSSKSFTTQYNVNCLQFHIENYPSTTDFVVPVLKDITTTGSAEIKEVIVERRSEGMISEYDKQVCKLFYSFGNEAATVSATLHMDADSVHAAFDFPFTLEIFMEE